MSCLLQAMEVDHGETVAGASSSAGSSGTTVTPGPTLGASWQAVVPPVRRILLIIISYEDVFMCSKKASPCMTELIT